MRVTANARTSELGNPFEAGELYFAVGESIKPTMAGHGDSGDPLERVKFYPHRTAALSELKHDEANNSWMFQLKMLIDDSLTRMGVNPFGCSVTMLTDVHPEKIRSGGKIYHRWVAMDVRVKGMHLRFVKGGGIFKYCLVQKAQIRIFRSMAALLVAAKRSKKK